MNYMITANRMILLFYFVVGLLTACLGAAQMFTLRNQLDKHILQALHTAEKEMSIRLKDRRPSRLTSSLMIMYLKPLYFHLDNLTVHVSEMHVTSSEFELEETNLDIFAQKMTPVVHFPWVQVNGKFKMGLNTNLPQQFQFRLIQNNLRGKGVVSLSVDLVNVIWSYFYFKSNSSSIIEIKDNQENGVDPVVLNVLNSSYFSELLAKKLRRDLSHQLSKVVSKNINQTLKTSSKLMSLQPYTEEISALAINNTENANAFIDSILRIGGTIIRGKYADRIKIPDIVETFSEKFVVTFRGSFRASEGAAIGVSSVYRIGDVIFGYDNESLLHFYGTLGFKSLRLYYRYYKADLWGMGPSGSLDTKLSPLAVLVHVHLNTTSKIITLEKFKITNVGDLEVSLTGLGGMFSWLLSQVTTWVVGLYRDEVLQQLESKYEQYGREIFATYSLEELLGRGKKRSLCFIEK